MIRLNGKPQESAHGRLLDLLAEQGISPDTRGVAVAQNGTVVPRSRWAETALADGDDIEIVKIMQGG
jgi:sulfur carrier protein